MASELSFFTAFPIYLIGLGMASQVIALWRLSPASAS
jgi:hypothetical protein